VVVLWIKTLPACCKTRPAWSWSAMNKGGRERERERKRGGGKKVGVME